MSQSQLPFGSTSNRFAEQAPSEPVPSEEGLPGEPLSCDLKFYWGVASGSSRKAIEMSHHDDIVEDHGQTVDLSGYPAAPYAMISYETRNNIPKPGPSWFVDCGAFSALNNSNRHIHEKSVSDYIEYLLKHIDSGVSIERWALRDWPYSQEILAATGRTIRDHQRWSVRDHFKCLEKADELGLSGRPGAEPVPVIQGRGADDYLWHLDYMREHGLLDISSVVCIGSLVNRSIKEAQSIIERVRDALPSKYAIHGLGVKKSHLKNVAAVEILDSVDTTSWALSTMKRSGGDSQTANWIDNLEAYVDYRAQLEAEFGGQGVDETLTLSITDFMENPSAVIGTSEFALMECVGCGSMLDANAVIDGRDDVMITGSGCRHCERARLNIQMGVDGLLCDPDVEDSECHPLCQRDHYH